MSKLRILMISIMVLTAVFLAGSSCFAAEVKIETHRYSPIAPADDPGAVSRCKDPLHLSDPKCKLVSWAIQPAEEDVHTTAEYTVCSELVRAAELATALLTVK